MVEAGLEVLRASGVVENPMEADRLIVEAVFLAMCRQQWQWPVLLMQGPREPRADSGGQDK
jgi:hypothetical protein